MINNNEVNKMVNVPKGKKVVIEPVVLIYKDTKSYEYNIYLAEELHPLHKLQEYPIRDYSDYIGDKPFFKTKEEMEKALNKNNILNFIKQHHSELLIHIENKGLILCHEWINYNELL